MYIAFLFIYPSTDNRRSAYALKFHLMHMCGHIGHAMAVAATEKA